MKTASVRNLALTAAALLLPIAAAAQDAPDKDRDQNNADIVVTGTLRVRQGGAQDIKHFRNIASDIGMPHPEALTAEGLMGEHDLTLPTARALAPPAMNARAEEHEVAGAQPSWRSRL